MDTQTYLKDATDRVLEILKDAFGDYFKVYVNGIMTEIPESQCPLVMATSSDGEISADATGTDAITEKLVIVMVVNQKDFIGGGDAAALADIEIRRKVYAQDPTTKQYLPHTIMYALRRNFTLDDGVVDNTISFDFSPVQRGSDFFTQEATLTLYIKRLAMVPNRT